MSLPTNDQALERQLGKLNVNAESKYEEEILDETIVNGFKGENKAFCLKIESFLNQFMKTANDSEMIPDLDKYKRKIVHKICDLYDIKRDYVDIKNDELGSITITKTITSSVPSITLEERYKNYINHSKKAMTNQTSNPFGNKKILIKTRAAQPDGKSASDKNSSSKGDKSKGNEDAVPETHEEVEIKKKKDYEQARDRILQREDDVEEPSNNSDPSNKDTTNKNITVKTKKKNRYEYDPDYDRFQSQPNSRSQPDPSLPMGLGNTMNAYPGMPYIPGPSNMNGVPFYPVYNPPFVPYHNYPMQQPFNQPYPPQNFIPFQNPYGQPFPNNGGGNQQMNNGPPPSGYYRNFPNLDSNSNQKK